MIDGVKILLPKKYIRRFIKNPLLKHDTLINADTGEVQEYQFEKYLGLRLRVISRGVLINGSLHKAFNIFKSRGEQNFNSFEFNEIVDFIDHLSRELGFDLKDALIQNLEIGLNIQTSIPAQQLLERNLIFMKDRRASSIKTFHRKGYFTEFEFSQYYFKIYDKGTQFQLDSCTLRVEIKAIKSQFFTNKLAKVIPRFERHPYQLRLADLQDINVLLQLLCILIKYFETVVICDSFEPSHIHDEDHRVMLLEGCNPNYWEDLHSSVKSSDFRKKRRAFNKLMDTYGLDTLKKEILSKLQDEKCRYQLIRGRYLPVGIV